MKLKYPFYALIIFLFFHSCTEEKYTYGTSDLIEMEKEPCFGYCPVYTFTINGVGEAKFNGIRNVEKKGEWTKSFSIEETNELFLAFSNSSFWDWKDEYTAQVTDLPTIWVSFKLGEKQKKIKDYYGAPAELKELEKILELMAEAEENWNKTE